MKILLILLGLLSIICSHERKYDINFVTLDICNMVIKNAMDKLSSDNLSVVVIGLEGLEKYIANKKNKDSKDKINSINNDIKKK